MLSEFILSVILCAITHSDSVTYVTCQESRGVHVDNTASACLRSWHTLSSSFLRVYQVIVIIVKDTRYVILRFTAFTMYTRRRKQWHICFIRHSGKDRTHLHFCSKDSLTTDNHPSAVLCLLIFYPLSEISRRMKYGQPVLSFCYCITGSKHSTELLIAKVVRNLTTDCLAILTNTLYFTVTLWAPNLILSGYEGKRRMSYQC